MQAEEQKINDLQQVAKDVLAKVDQVFQEAVDQLLGKKEQQKPQNQPVPVHKPVIVQKLSDHYKLNASYPLNAVLPY